MHAPQGRGLQLLLGQKAGEASCRSYNTMQLDEKASLLQVDGMQHMPGCSHTNCMSG